MGGDNGDDANPPRARSRAPRGTVSRDKIVAAALAAVVDGRFDSMTIRSLADDLGVAPMTIYRHVRSRDDLVDEVAEAIFAREWRPVVSDDWRQWVIATSMMFRRILVDHPPVIQVYLRHPVESASSLERMHAMVNCLRGAGFSAETVRTAHAAIYTYTVGFAALEVSRSQWSLHHSDEEGRFVHARSLVTTEQFTTGLGFLLDGIRSGL